MSEEFDFDRALHDFEFKIRGACMAQMLVHDIEGGFTLSEEADALGERILKEVRKLQKESVE